MRDGWEEKRLKDILQSPLIYGLNEPAEDENPEDPRYIRITDFDENENLRSNTFKSIPLLKAKNYILKTNDILFARSGATVGKSFLYKSSNGLACFAGYLIRARLNEKIVSPFFFSYLTKSYYYDNWKGRVNIQSTIQNISAEKYNQLEFPLPSLSEQIAIADYLDKKTAQIAAQIKLLETKRDTYLRLKKSLINKAVTKGLNPDVESEESGIDWLGKIPKHWKVKRIKEVFDYVNRGTTPNYVEESPYKVVNQATFSKGYWDIENIRFTTNNRKDALINKGDLLIASTGGGVLGKVYYVDFDCDNYYVDSHVTIVRYSNSIRTKFLYYLLNTKYDMINALFAKGSTNQTELQRSQFINFIIPFTEIEEQEMIVNYLDQQSRKIDDIVSNINQQIGKLQTLRKSLINEVVTGERSIV